jgi:hypothetical protein
MSIDTAAANEATSYNADEDPWATGATEPPAEDAAPSEFDEFDDLLAELEEEESGEAIQVPSSARIYSNPRDVGLKDMQWVPIRILSADVDPKHVPRLSSKTCIAKLGDKKFVLYDAIEAAIKAGATEEQVERLPLPYFVATANHASDEFQRRFPYEIEVPVFSVKTALFKQQANGRTGYKNESGRSLRLATGATTQGETVSKDNWDEIANRMEDTIILAQLSISQSKKARFRSVLDEQNNPVNVLLNPESGDAVTVLGLKDDKGRITGYVLDDGNGEVWEGDEKLLFPIPGQDSVFAILDDSENAGPLQEQYFPINDYLKTTFLPLPERKVMVETLEEDEVEGEITLDTIGALAKGNSLGVHVDVFLKTGKKVTAVWLGTQWQEVRSDKGEGGGLSEYAGGKDPVEQL